MKPLDLQVNGFGGVDFNSDTLTADGLREACRQIVAAGGGEILATVITADLDAMCRRLETLVRLLEADPEVAAVVAGIHIEGPFISGAKGYVGAHPPAAVRPADPDTMKRLLEATGGLTRLVTLAPECDPGYAVTEMLAGLGVCVSAGHCDPTLDQLRGAIDHGLRMFTHLGNGCPMELHRHDNVIQRALSLSEEIWICLIADGIHVPFPAFRNYLRAAGVERSIVVTDAISAAGLEPGTYTLGDWKIAISDDGVARSPDGSHFVGSTVTMDRTRANLATLGLDPGEIDQLTCHNPRLALDI